MAELILEVQAEEKLVTVCLKDPSYIHLSNQVQLEEHVVGLIGQGALFDRVQKERHFCYGICPFSTSFAQGEVSSNLVDLTEGLQNFSDLRLPWKQWGH